MQTRGVERPAQWALVMATVLPTVLALNVPPSPTLLNQCLAIACWGVVVTLIGQLTSVPARAFVVEAWPVVAAIGLLLVCGIGSSLFAFWPASLAWSTLPSMVFAMIVLHAAHRAYRSHPQRIAAWFFTGVLCAGLINSVIGVIQFFWPDAPDGDWIARSGAVGRAVGNLRQPNHLSSWLLWSLVVVAGLLETGRMTRRAAWGAGALLLGATVLTGSRTGHRRRAVAVRLGSPRQRPVNGDPSRTGDRPGRLWLDLVRSHDLGSCHWSLVRRRDSSDRPRLGRRHLELSAWPSGLTP